MPSYKDTPTYNLLVGIEWQLRDDAAYGTKYQCHSCGEKTASGTALCVPCTEKELWSRGVDGEYLHLYRNALETASEAIKEAEQMRMLIMREFDDS